MLRVLGLLCAVAMSAANAAAQEPARPTCGGVDLLADIATRGPEIALSFCPPREREAACSNRQVLDLASRLQAVALFHACGRRDGVPPDRCAGTDHVEALRRQSPERLEAALNRARGRFANAEGLLWRVDRDGIPPSFLFGTASGDDPRLRPLPPALLAAVRNARVLFVVHEIEPRQPDRPGDPMGSPASFCPYYLRRVGIDPFTMEEALARALPPGARILSLESREDLARWEAERPQALERFDDVPYGIDAAGEMATFIGAHHLEMPSASMEVLVEAGALDPAWREFDVENRAYHSLRDARWMERAADELAQGGVVMAVGAVHLAGENGVIELLRRQGYRVGRVR